MADIVYYYPNGHEAHFEHGHPERPERVEVIKNALEHSGYWSESARLASLTLPENLLQSIHSPAYLNVLELTCKRGGHLDPDTYTKPDSWDIAHKTAGGAAAVTAEVWEKKAKRGFALTRPPGHHAMRGQGMGFCLLNNIALAAEHLIMEKGAQRLAIIDLDLHHGNGTQDIFWKRDDVLYISIHQSPFYPGTGDVGDIGSGVGEGWTANFPLPPGSGDAAFITIIDELILPILDHKKPQMLLISYGFDTHWLDPLGQLLLTANGYGKMIYQLCNWADRNCEGRAALILEGGYDLAAASACSIAVTSAMLGNEWTDPHPCPYNESSAWKNMVNKAKSIWNL